MSLEASVGESAGRSSARAGADAARAALEGAPARRTLALVFATAGHDQAELLEGIRSVLGDVPLVGCTGSGVITRSGSDEGSHRVAVAILGGEGVRVDVVKAAGYGADSRAAATTIAAAMAGKRRPCLALVFPDGLTGNASAFVAALADALGPDVPIFGGASGEMMRFERTFQYRDDEVLSDSVVAAFVHGDFEVDFAVSHGCSLLGVEHHVTRAEGSTVLELDGRPAWHVMREYVDATHADFSADVVPYLCLAQPLTPGASESEYVIRVPLGLDADRGALFFPGELPEGSVVQMARREVADVISRTHEAARALRSRHPGVEPLLVIQADCAGRGRLLFGDQVTRALVLPTQNAVSPLAPFIGLHSYGEIAPLHGRAFFHQYTLALAALYPRSDATP